jgi:Bifunctional DNA primase/polymerase, N-terminal/Primase C terminal 1 (PriCT-1)
MEAQGVFAAWQPRYAERGIPTFPVNIETKKPLVKGYLNLDLSDSRNLIAKFPATEAFGFAVGSRTGITILDIDSSDESDLSDALALHGRSKIIVRTGSGNFHVWFRHNGEPRLIRPSPNVPLDILGAGYVVAPPSWGTTRSYEIIKGSLDDLRDLPVMRGLPTNYTGPVAPEFTTEPIRQGERNNKLFKHCMRAAHHCDCYDALLDVARTFNDGFLPRLSDDEVIRTARSVWGYTTRGMNRFGRPGVFFDADEANHLIRTDPDGFMLLAFLRANNGPERVFLIANALAKHLGWTRKRMAAARRRLEGAYVYAVRSASRDSGPARYRWIKGGQN